jgi:RecA/RadA recombinase
MIPSGCVSLDKLLGAGFPIGGTSLIYGEAETGKSVLAMQAAVNAGRRGCKTIFVDTDCAFSPIRLSQIAYNDFDEIAPRIILVRPTSFQEQSAVIDSLDEYLTKKIQLVVIDTITSLYRVEFGTAKETFALNRELNRQVAGLTQISKTYDIAVLMISQVRNVLTEERENATIEPVGTRVLTFWSDVVINLKKTPQTRVIKAVLEKSPKHRHPVSCYFTIAGTGVRDQDQSFQGTSAR